MASNSEVEQHKTEATVEKQSIGLGFLPSALGTRSTGVPTHRSVSPSLDEEGSEVEETEEVDPPLTLKVRSSGSRSLANRVHKPSKARSALEVLKASKVEQSPKTATPKGHSAPTGVRQVHSGTKTVDEILRETFGTYDLRTVYRIENLQVNKALWASHHARAMDSSEYELCVAARGMRNALSIDSGEDLRACRIRTKGKEYAVWVSLKTGETLCVLSPADVYLMGWTVDS